MEQNDKDNDTNTEEQDARKEELFALFEENFAELDDAEFLQVFSFFLGRISISCNQVANEDDIVTHQYMALQCGEASLISELTPVAVPMQPIRNEGETIN